MTGHELTFENLIWECPLMTSCHVRFSTVTVIDCCAMLLFWIISECSYMFIDPQFFLVEYVFIDSVGETFLL